jgi:hypothetical protein
MAVAQEQVVSTALSVIDSIDTNLVDRTLKKIEQFQEVVQKMLKQGHDYGIIPGCQKPSLLKPGAEKINMLMGIASDYDIMDKTEDYDKGFFAYNVRCILLRGGVLVCTGVGNCNSREKKYVTQDPYSIANTILKMAKKRAYVDATLSLASLSDIFTQDLEDMDLPVNEASNEANKGKSPGDTVITFGKHKGTTVADLYKNDNGYFKWLMGEKDGKNNSDKMKPICEAYLQSLKSQPAPAPEGDLTNKDWSAFWAKTNQLGIDKDTVNLQAASTFNLPEPPKSLKDVIKNRTSLNLLLKHIEEGVFEEEVNEGERLPGED